MDLFRYFVAVHLFSSPLLFSLQFELISVGPTGSEMRDRCASSPEAPESILCLIAWTMRLILRSPLLSMTCIWSFSCSGASGDALHERDFRMLPKHELLLVICDLLISLLSPRTYLPFCIRSVLARKPAAFRLTASAISSAKYFHTRSASARL